MSSEKIFLNPEDLLPRIEALRADGKVIVFGNGCFDLIHVGHIRYLQAAKALGDVLIIAVNTDGSVKQTRPDRLPINPDHERFEVLAALEPVDFVIPLADRLPNALLEMFQPDIQAKGTDYTLERMPEFDERIAVKCVLRRFTVDETVSYIQHRLHTAGATRPIFEPDALEAIHRLSYGIPRRINRLCDLSLLIGFAEERASLSTVQIESVSNDFHARYSAVKREYCYFIAIRPQALHRNFVWQLAYTLNIDDMNQAAKLIEGRHNFESFCRTKSDVKHHDCHVEFSNWSQRGEHLIYTIRADRFLHGMVRTLVGMFVDIGRYRLKTSDIRSILETKNRKAAGQAAPPQGLILEKVYYK